MIPVETRSSEATWKTSVFPDEKSATYLLPLEKEIRVRLGCIEGSEVSIELTVRSIRPTS